MILIGALMGVGGTVFMDIWALFLARLPGQPPVNWAPVGRWFRYLGKGQVFHNDIGRVPPVRHEAALGWLCHYLVGILYGVIFVLLVGANWLGHPTFLPAWIFGLVTVGAGWFLLQPGLGLGIAASRTPAPAKVRLLNLLAHTVFALGLYATARLLA